MAPSPGLQLRCLTSLLCVPILILRPQLSSLWWFQPPVSTAACPCPCQLPPSLSRRQRLAVTKTLNNQWQELPPDPSPVRWHCRRACHHQQRRQAWAGWPHRGMRIGEAQNPGPPLPSTPAGRERSPARQPQAQRVFCPVPACPCSDPARARGLGHSRNDEVPHRCTPCRLLARGCAHCLAPFPQPHSVSRLRSQCFPSSRGPPHLPAGGSGRSGRCHPNGH